MDDLFEGKSEFTCTHLEIIKKLEVLKNNLSFVHPLVKGELCFGPSGTQKLMKDNILHLNFHTLFGSWA